MTSHRSENHPGSAIHHLCQHINQIVLQDRENNTKDSEKNPFNGRIVANPIFEIKAKEDAIELLNQKRRSSDHSVQIAEYTDFDEVIDEEALTKIQNKISQEEKIVEIKETYAKKLQEFSNTEFRSKADMEFQRQQLERDFEHELECACLEHKPKNLTLKKSVPLLLRPFTILFWGAPAAVKAAAETVLEKVGKNPGNQHRQNLSQLLHTGLGGNQNTFIPEHLKNSNDEQEFFYHATYPDLIDWNYATTSEKYEAIATAKRQQLFEINELVIKNSVEFEWTIRKIEAEKLKNQFVKKTEYELV